MLKTILTAAAFVGIMGIAQTALADDDRYDWYETPPQQSYDSRDTTRDWYDDRDSHRHYGHRGVRNTEVLERTFNTRVRNESIGLLRGSGLKRDYRGYRVEAVIVTLRPHKSRGRIGLLVNGYRVDAARMGGERRIRLDTGKLDLLGREIKRLRLDVKGRAFIKDVKIKLSHPGYARGKGRPGFVYDNVSLTSAKLLARAILAQINHVQENGQEYRQENGHHRTSRNHRHD